MTLTFLLTRLTSIFWEQIIPELAAMAERNLEVDGLTPDQDKAGVMVRTGDGLKDGGEMGPFDAIYVGGAVSEVPDGLVEQLRAGGRMIIAVGPDGEQQLSQAA